MSIVNDIWFDAFPAGEYNEDALHQFDNPEDEDRDGLQNIGL
jgi:hypothetical protein